MNNTVYLRDLLDLDLLEDALQGGYVREQTHIEQRLRIFNYTEKTQYECAWTPTTMTCRGLIVNDQDEVIARPFPKFFNYGDPKTGELDLSAPAVVLEKLDGSLGILYPTSDGYAIATRGSFASEQANHATKLFRQRYSDFVPPEGLTVLFEIIYPENRIVCDYDGADDLFLLGAVDIASGEVFSPAGVSGWRGPIALFFNAGTLAEALAMPPRDGAEGLVVRLVDTGQMVKIKQADYVALHKIVTGLNARGIWEALGAGKTVQQICEPLPDEFHQWVCEVAGSLKLQAEMTHEAARVTYDNILEKLDQEHPDGWVRRDFAEWALRCSNSSYLFALLDGKDPRPAIWKTLRPAADIRPITISEESA